MAVTPSFFFYDLETTGTSPAGDRIMQFAGQRTDMALQPIGEPVNQLIKLTDDVLPQPDAILITGITPQKTASEGVSEADFLRIFEAQVSIAGTIFVGFNNVRFDDEFIRYLRYRNFYDAYSWHWQDERSRWDILDVVRLTRALRPEGIAWPFTSEGKPTNRLELLTSVNKIEHTAAHDAMSDVWATIAVARLIQQKQPKLFNFLLKLRQKNAVEKLLNSDKTVVYASGKYPSQFLNTTVVQKLADTPRKSGALVYDLRQDPAPFLDMTPQQLAAAWKWSKDAEALRLPIKNLLYNRCPAVAPLGVLTKANWKALGLTLELVESRREALKGRRDFVERVLKAVEILDGEQQTRFLATAADVDAQLYDGFISPPDQTVSRAIRAADPGDLAGFEARLHDVRLKALLPLYKARNFPQQLTTEERRAWEQHRRQVLLGGGLQSKAHRYFGRLEELASQPALTGNQRYLLEELQLYGQSIMPDLTNED